MGESEFFFVPGRPATFATKAEAAWKQLLAEQIPAPSRSGTELGVWLDFLVPSLTNAEQPFDIDNLCEPVFSVLVNRRGWFRGWRPNIRWWHATRRVGRPSGCAIRCHAMADLRLPVGEPLVAGVYRGPHPASASSVELAAWAMERAAALGSSLISSSWALYLGFGDSMVNIGDIATGRVKACLDCLYPVLGGVAGAPEDYRVSSMAVEKAVPGLAADQIAIRLWTVAEEKAPDWAEAEKNGGAC